METSTRSNRNLGSDALRVLAMFGFVSSESQKDFLCN